MSYKRYDKCHIAFSTGFAYNMARVKEKKMAINWSIEHESGLAGYEAESEYIPDEGEVIVCGECGAPVIDGTICESCGTPTDGWLEDNPDYEDDCPLDGDAQSALASCGWGTDEDYEHYDAW